MIRSDLRMCTVVQEVCVISHKYLGCRPKYDRVHDFLLCDVHNDETAYISIRSGFASVSRLAAEGVLIQARENPARIVQQPEGVFLRVFVLTQRIQSLENKLGNVDNDLLRIRLM